MISIAYNFKKQYFCFIKCGHSSVVERLVANEKVEVRPPLPAPYFK